MEMETLHKLADIGLCLTFVGTFLYIYIFNPPWKRG